MRSPLRLVARVASVTGLAAVAAVHLVWAGGSSWPATDRMHLAEAVVGSDVRMPGTLPTLTVAGGTGVVALCASGALGDGCLPRVSQRAMSVILLGRAMLGGEAALALLRLPRAGAHFRRLDTRYYRPFAALLGLALWISAKPPRSADAPPHPR